MAYHNLTLQKIAQFTDNAISTVGTWKNGRLPASMSTIEKLAEIFQVTTDYLLTGATASVSNTASIHSIHEVENEIQSSSTAGFNARSSQPTTSSSWTLAGTAGNGLRQQINAHLQRYLDGVEQSSQSPEALQRTWATIQELLPIGSLNS